MNEPVDRLLGAVTDLLVAEGYEGVSVRKVAATAGVSIGAVQHHFPTKDAMLTAAMERAARQFQERLTRRVDPDSDAATVLRAVADELLATDAEARAGSALWVVQLARATVDPSTAARHRADWQQVENLLADLLAGARPDLDPVAVRHGAGALLALVDGLATAALVEPGRMPPARARSLLVDALDALLRAPGPGTDRGPARP